MSRTIRNTEHANKYGIRVLRSRNYLAELEKAKEEITEYVGKCTQNRIKNTGRIPTSYDDKHIAAISEEYRTFTDDYTVKYCYN